MDFIFLASIVGSRKTILKKSRFGLTRSFGFSKTNDGCDISTAKYEIPLPQSFFFVFTRYNSSHMRSSFLNL